MKVLSLHSLGHDSGVSYLENGKLVLSVETERLTRVKHDHRVELALQYVLAQPQVDVDGIDLITVSSPVRSEILQLPDPDTAMATVRSGAPHHLTTSHLLGRPVPCVVVTHEVAHAALAAHYAGYQEGTLILVNEGRGRSPAARCSGSTEAGWSGWNRTRCPGTATVSAGAPWATCSVSARVPAWPAR